ncbi:MAG: LamG domain-containing protein, partial [Planctomycetota bacterium]
TEGLDATERVGIVLGSYDSSPNTNWELHAKGEMRLYWNGGEINRNGTTDLRDDTWHHIAWVRDKATNANYMYIDRGLEATIPTLGTDITFNTTHKIGGDNRGSPPNFHGLLDDVQVYSRALSQDELREITKGLYPQTAFSPNPANGAVDVPVHPILSWKPADTTAATYDVYFGTSSTPPFVGNQVETSYEPGFLKVATTYYWQVDAVEADGTTVHTGDLWSFTTSPSNILVNTRVSASSDDAEEHVLDDGKMETLTSSDLELGYEGAMAPASLQTIGCRWVGVDIPKGVTITKAWVQFDADDVNNDWHIPDVSLIIEGELTPDPVTFSSTAGDITARPTTTANVVWDIPRWMKTHVQGPGEQTPDISSIIQEIVNQDGWAIGNAIVLMFRDNPDKPSQGTREAESYDGTSSAAPLLHIETSTDKAYNPDPADGAVGVTTDPTLSWRPGALADTHDVYFGTSSEPALIGSQAATSYVPGLLEQSTTYYWRVDEVEADGTTIHTGDVWSFTTGIVVHQRIATGDDDVEERLRPDRVGAIDMTSSDLEFPYEDFPADDQQRVGMRFVDVRLPKGAQVLNAYIEFEVDETKGGTSPVNVVIDGELTPDAALFANTPLNISLRPLWTTAVVKWSVPDWTAKDEKFQTLDISSIIQEIVNQDGWVGGNAIVLTIYDDPDNPSTGVRCAESYNGEAEAAPLLHIVATGP